MAKNVTMRDIAVALGMSAVSVSKALSGRDGVSDEAREKIIRAAESMGYRYKPALGLSERMRSVGVLVSERFIGDRSFYSDMYAKVAISLGKIGCASTLEILSDESEKSLALPMFIESKSVDAFIALGQLGRPYIEELSRSAMPFIFLDFYDDDLDVDSIISDSMYGSYMLTSYLIKNGCRDIGFVGSLLATSSILDRYLGYHMAIVKNSLETRRECMIDDRDSGGIFEEIALPDALPDAFVCNCDDTAARLVRQLSALGVKVPDDISIVGFDDHLSAIDCVPKLTTFRVDTSAMATAAVEAIQQKIALPRSRVRCKIIGGEIVERDSVKLSDKK